MTTPSLDPTSQCAPDTGRAVLRVSGADRIKFLQGLVTQDMRRVEAEGIGYGALLTPQGKLIADFLLVALPEAVLIDADARVADELLRRLTMFRLRSAVEIARVDMPVTRGIGPAPDGALQDPRAAALGWRLYGAALTQGAAVDWTALMIDHRIPQTGADAQPGESFILELGFERLNGVDFRKGCYVGQEVTARMHHKTDLRRGLMRVALDGAAMPGTPIETAEGKTAGTLGSIAGDRALAMLRFDRASGPLFAQGVPVRVLD